MAYGLWRRIFLSKNWPPKTLELYSSRTSTTPLSRWGVPFVYISEHKQVVQSVAVIVTNPGDLRNETQRAHVGSLVRDFETASYAYGSNSTFYFLKAYMDFLQFFHSDDEEVWILGSK